MSAEAQGSAVEEWRVVGPALAVALLTQGVGLELHDLGRDPAGLPLEVAPVNALMLQVPG